MTLILHSDGPMCTANGCTEIQSIDRPVIPSEIRRKKTRQFVPDSPLKDTSPKAAATETYVVRASRSVYEVQSEIEELIISEMDTGTDDAGYRDDVGFRDDDSMKDVELSTVVTAKEVELEALNQLNQHQPEDVDVVIAQQQHRPSLKSTDKSEADGEVTELDPADPDSSVLTKKQKVLRRCCSLRKLCAFRIFRFRPKTSTSSETEYESE